MLDYVFHQEPFDANHLCLYIFELDLIVHDLIVVSILYKITGIVDKAPMDCI